MHDSDLAHRIDDVYGAFNDRDSDFVVKQMTADVE